MKRIGTEMENLRSNLAKDSLSADTVTWIDEQIQERMACIRELVDLQSQPIGAAVLDGKVGGGNS